MDLVNALERDASFSVIGADDDDDDNASFSSDDLEASARRDHSSHTTLNHSLMNHSSSNHHHHRHNNSSTGRRPSRVSSNRTRGSNDDPNNNTNNDDSVFSSDDEMGRSGRTTNSEYTSASHRHHVVAELRDDTKGVTNQIDRRRKLVPLLGMVALVCLFVAVGTSAAAIAHEKEKKEEYQEFEQENIGNVDLETLWVRYCLMVLFNGLLILCLIWLLKIKRLVSSLNLTNVCCFFGFRLYSKKKHTHTQNYAITTTYSLI